MPAHAQQPRPIETGELPFWQRALCIGLIIILFSMLAFLILSQPRVRLASQSQVRLANKAEVTR